jgi:hypothetical protein
VSYGSLIERGTIPHPRHFEVLAQLAGVEMPAFAVGNKDL